LVVYAQHTMKPDRLDITVTLVRNPRRFPESLENVLLNPVYRPVASASIESFQQCQRDFLGDLCKPGPNCSNLRSWQ